MCGITQNPSNGKQDMVIWHIHSSQNTCT